MPEMPRFLVSTPPFATSLQQHHPNSCLRNNMAVTLSPCSPISHKSASSVALKCLLPCPSVPRDLPSSAWMTGWLLKFPQPHPSCSQAKFQDTPYPLLPTGKSTPWVLAFRSGAPATCSAIFPLPISTHTAFLPCPQTTPSPRAGSPFLVLEVLPS